MDDCIQSSVTNCGHQSKCENCNGAQFCDYHNVEINEKLQNCLQELSLRIITRTDVVNKKIEELLNRTKKIDNCIQTTCEENINKGISCEIN